MNAFSIANASTSTTLRAESAEIERGDAQVDVLRARCREQHVDHVRVVFHRTQHFEIEADFLDRIRDVLVRLDLDLRFHVLFGEVRGHGDDLGDHGRARYRSGGELDLRARSG